MHSDQALGESHIIIGPFVRFCLSRLLMRRAVLTCFVTTRELQKQIVDFLIGKKIREKHTKNLMIKELLRMKNELLNSKTTKKKELAEAVDQFNWDLCEPLLEKYTYRCRQIQQAKYLVKRINKPFVSEKKRKSA